MARQAPSLHQSQERPPLGYPIDKYGTIPWTAGMNIRALRQRMHPEQKNKGTPPWGGCGFSTIVYLVIESKITFLHCNLQYFVLVIYDVLTFAARCQNAKKKTCAIPQHLLEVQCILFFLSALSVERNVIIPPHPPTLPPGQGSKTSATKLGNVSSVASSFSRKERYHPPPPGQGSKMSATKLGNVSSVASSYSRQER